MKQSYSEMIQLRGKFVHLRRWGEKTAPVVFMLHGWMDMSATFQFVVDEFQQQWQIIAPDWAGFGKSPARPGANHFTEYLLDIHEILNRYSPNEPAKIVAHSMGANVINLYAGAYPERVSHFVNIEAMGPMPGIDMYEPEARLREWIGRAHDSLKRKPYKNVETFARRLKKSNQLLSDNQAMFLAAEFSEQMPDGSIEMEADEIARAVTPFFAPKEVFMACWGGITAKVLFFRGGQSFMTKAFDTVPGELGRRYALINHFQEIIIDQAGHNLQHDFPQRLASEIEFFFVSSLESRKPKA